MAVVVTDLYPHRMWIRGKPDLYCVPTDWSLGRLRQRVGAAPRAESTGIPIGLEFSDPKHRNRPNGKPRLLFSTGGIGGGPVVQAVRNIATLPFPAHLDVMCGLNTNLLDQIRTIESTATVTVDGHGIVPNEEMAQRMGQSDLLIGKSGGLTTAEALACGLPFLVLDECLIPGQEERNAEFLQEVGAGIRVGSLSDLPSRLTELIQDRAQITQMQARALENARPKAAEQILALLD
jgi:processive 1,2-diacylglycerol beta-glucosyltransferase